MQRSGDSFYKMIYIKVGKLERNGCQSNVILNLNMSSNVTHSPKSSKRGVSGSLHHVKPRSSKSLRPRKLGITKSKPALQDGICGTSKPNPQFKHSLAILGVNPKITANSLITDKLKVVNLQFSFPSQSTNPSTLRSDECSSQ